MSAQDRRYRACHPTAGGIPWIITAHRESRFLDACLETRQPFAVDKVNATRAGRARFVQPALSAGYRTVAYWLDVRPNEAIARNAARSGRGRIPVPAILGTYKRLEVPRKDEGIAAMWRVEVLPDGFIVGPLPADLAA